MKGLAHAKVVVNGGDVWLNPRAGAKRSEIADVALYLASERATYIPGQTLFVDGGLTLCHG